VYHEALHVLLRSSCLRDKDVGNHDYDELKTAAMLADMDTITAGVLAALARGEPLDAAALTFLLRQYRDGDRADLGDALGTALADALARYADDSGTLARAGWLRMFAEAAAISDDERLADAARALTATLVREWPVAAIVGEASASIDACLTAAHLADPHTLIPDAIDELERVVGGAYRPGMGVAHAIGGAAHGRGGLADQLHAASALLTAFELTGRLPYSMLAEELMQLSRAEVEAHPDIGLTCQAVRVLCRLAALHDDEAYRKAAVIATAADYRGDAERTLERISRDIGAGGRDAAPYGVALGEWRARPNVGRETP
jgi:hypothetical protein